MLVRLYKVRGTENSEKVTGQGPMTANVHVIELDAHEFEFVCSTGDVGQEQNHPSVNHSL